MLPAEVEKLKTQFTDKYVMVDATRPELARFAQLIGQIKTFNYWGRALVRFEGADHGWYDLDLAALVFVDPPPPKAAPAKEPAAKKPVEKKKTPEPES
jgi:hypothetical protein